MAEVTKAIGFAWSLYRVRAETAYAGYLLRDPVSLLWLRPGRLDPYPVYEQIRAQGTLVPTRRGNWVSPSHRVCDSVLRSRSFGSIGTDTDEVPFDLSFIMKNPPDHTRLRKLAMPAFSPRAVAGYTDGITRTVTDLLDRAAATAEFDLVSQFAAPVPIAVVSDLLGIPDEDRGGFAHHGAAIASAIDGISSLRQAAQFQRSNAYLKALFTRVFELRRREPADDIVSRLVAMDEDQIKPGELLPMCLLLLFAGFVTTVNLIANSVLALLSQPDQWRNVCEDPQRLAPRAVEETLRFDPPIQSTGRVALEAVELEGRPVRKGQKVATLIGAANRDPEVYQDPDRFDIHREGAPENLAFSSGIHYCLGKPLAGLEATIALQLLAERMPDLALAGPARRRRTLTIRGPFSLPVRHGLASR